MNDNDRESQYFLEKSKLEGEIKSLQSKLESLESKRVQDNIIVARYEIAKVSSKWVLYTPRDREISIKTLKDLIELFMDYREFHYEQGEAISIYDRDRMRESRKLRNTTRRFYDQYTETKGHGRQDESRLERISDFYNPNRERFSSSNSN